MVDKSIRNRRVCRDNGACLGHVVAGGGAFVVVRMEEDSAMGALYLLLSYMYSARGSQAGSR